VDGARAILKEAFKSINSESIWLAAVKLESENGEYERARILLAKARDNVGTERVWLKSAVLDRQLGRLDDARALVAAARDKYPAYAKLWMVSGQIEESSNDTARARELYAEGVRLTP
jgi:pre-mRNA-processing factor 6